MTELNCFTNAMHKARLSLKFVGKGRDHDYNSGVSLQLHPGVRLQWRRCADAPVEMARAQAIVVGGKVYVGGGATPDKGDWHKVFQYNRRGDTWSTLPHSPVRLFGMAHFMGRITAAGGVNQQNSLSNKVYAIMEGSQQWEEFVSPMPTSRFGLSVATTSVAIIAAGGNTSATSLTPSSAVEVYSSDTSQWHTADPLSIPCVGMSSVIINDTCYLLGGADQSNRAINSCWSAPIQSLVHKGVSRSASGSVWNHLPPTPLYWSTAACLSGSLVAVGGKKNNTRSSAVHGFLNNSWVRLSNGDLLSPRSSCATAQLSPLEVIVIGGFDEQKQQSKTVFIGTLHLHI